eukprot:EG_transcript_13282
MSALREKSLLFGAVLVASTIAVGLLLNNQNAASFSVQPATQVQVSVVPEVVNPTLPTNVEDHQVGKPLHAAEVPVANVEEHLEEIGSVVTSVGKAALPLFAAFFAVVAGFFLQKLPPSGQQSPGLKPMEMAAGEDTPLARRGALTALATLPFAAASPAFAAKSGGRIGGGSGFRSFSARPAPRPPVTGGATIGGVTRGGAVFVAPSPPVFISPPVVASPFGFGFGAPVISYGFSTGELLALSALELGEAFVREQRRQEFLRQQLETQRKLGQNEAEISALQQQLAAQDKRMQELQEAMRSKGVPAPAQ